MKKKYIMPKATTISLGSTEQILAGSTFNANFTTNDEGNEYAKGFVEDEWID